MNTLISNLINPRPLWFLILFSLGLLSFSNLLITFLKWVHATFFKPERNLADYGSWALVTGATDGSGKTIAFELANKGLNLLLLGRNQDKLQDVTNSIRSKHNSVKCAMKCAEDCLKSLSNSILTACPEDVKFLSTRFDNKCMDRIQAVLSEGNFPRVSYTEAVEALQKASGTTFQTKVEWGITLFDEHQRYLADELHNKPIIVYNYPKNLKPFYSRSDDDTKTVSAFEVILPKVGKVVSGILKEERNYMISSRMKEVELAKEHFNWYLHLRRHGTVKHAGFQIIFHQLVMFLNGFGDIRDVVPYPRTKNDAKC